MTARMLSWVIIASYLLGLGALGISIAVIAGLPASGDEPFYLSQVRGLRQGGWWEAVCQGNPVGFSAPVLLLSFLDLSELTAGRLAALFSCLLVLAGQWYCCRRVFELDGQLTHLVILTSLQILLGARFVFNAITDPAFSAVLIWALIALWRSLRPCPGAAAAVVAGGLFAFTLAIRPLTVLYLPGLLAALAVTVLTRTGSRRIATFKVAGIFLLSFVTWFAAQQLPSLARHGRPQLENKNPVSGLTWTQRQLLTRMRLDQGQQAEPHLVSWAEVQQYLDTHGQDALPRDWLGALTFDPFLSLRSFTRHLAITTNYIFLRRLGILYPVLLVVLLLSLWPRQHREAVRFWLIILVGYVLAVGLLPVVGIEWRWLVATVALASVLGAAGLAGWSPQRPGWKSALVALQLLFVNTSMMRDLFHLLGR